MAISGSKPNKVTVDGTEVTVRAGSGIPGVKGDTGSQGPAGTAATVAVGTVTTLSPGSPATVSNSGTAGAAVLDFGIPQGVTGSQGPAGTAATVTVGSVTTGTAGSTATVTNSGTSSAAVLDFTIPRGDKGDTGSQGPQGATGPEGGTSTLTTKGDLLTRTTTAVARLPVGASDGHILTVDAAEATGMKWAAAPASGIPATLIDAKGDLIVGSAADTAARLAVGATNGHVLTVDSAQGLGVKWEINNGATPIRPLAGATAIWTLPGNYGQVDRNATIVLAANTLYYFPFSVPKAFTPSQIGIHVTSTGSGSAYLWLYAIDNDMATTGAPVLDVTSAGGYNVSTLGTKSTTGLTTKIEPGNFMFVLGSTAGITVQGSGIIHPWTDPTTPGSNNAWVYRRAVSPLPTTAPNPLTSWDTYSAQTTRSVFPVFWR